MSRAYTVLFGELYNPGAGAHLVYSAPDGFVSVIRDIVVANEATVPDAFLFYCLTGEWSPWIWRPVVETLGTAHLELRQVMQPGTELHCAATVSTWSCRVTGYQLAGGSLNTG